MHAQRLLTTLGVLILVSFPKIAFAWASVTSSPNPYARYDTITVWWNGGESEVCNDDEWFEVQIYGTNGFYGYDGNDYGDGSLQDSSANTSSPGSWSYNLDMQIYGDVCDYDYGASSATEASEAPHAASTSVTSEGYITPMSCSNIGGCTTAPWTYQRLYQLVDQWGNNYQEVAHVTESLSSVSDTCNVLLIEQDTYSNSAGQFYDDIRVCSSVCCGGGSCSSEYTQAIYSDDYYNVRNVDIQANCSGLASIAP